MSSHAIQPTQETSVTHDTFVIRRTYPNRPAQVFAALSDPAKKRRWFAEGEGHSLEEFSMDFRVGGSERLRVRIEKESPVKGCDCTADGTYQDIVPDRRIVIASTMSIAGRRISASLATFELLPRETGTELVFTHQAAFFEGADGPEMRKAGWTLLLDHFEKELHV